MSNLKVPEHRAKTPKQHLLRATLPSTAKNLTNAREILTNQLEKYRKAFVDTSAVMGAKDLQAFSVLVKALADLEKLTSDEHAKVAELLEDMSDDERAALESEARKLAP